MDEIKVIWTKIAVKQRNEIFDFWNNRNKNNRYSKQLNLKIYRKIDQLKKFPYTGVEIENENARVLHFENYSLIYRLNINKIFILAFWDTRQNPSKLLEILKLK
ncbi:type II toxin-antitoxin system RelE/ParE family toxin [Cloacibacterium sp.]|uniref:type II toxin-antitoxin system RelE/ParE family toxin n=1 Tax=Cloacibacterium sp. TaxID=1913682 RepID=UPI0035AE6437